MLENLTGTLFYKIAATVGVSMLPILELRGGIPFGLALGLDNWTAFWASFVGNMLPIPFIILFLRQFLLWLEKKIPKLGAMIAGLERRAHLKGRMVEKYKVLGLMILVAIPLPGTGAWTGALVAVFLDIRMKTALPVIALGVLIAGIIVTCITYGVSFFIG